MRFPAEQQHSRTSAAQIEKLKIECGGLRLLTGHVGLYVVICLLLY